MKIMFYCEIFMLEKMKKNISRLILILLIAGLFVSCSNKKNPVEEDATKVTRLDSVNRSMDNIPANAVKFIIRLPLYLLPF